MAPRSSLLGRCWQHEKLKQSGLVLLAGGLAADIRSERSELHVKILSPPFSPELFGRFRQGSEYMIRGPRPPTSALR